MGTTMKTIRDFMNLVEQDIDPSTVVLDPRPAATPADVSGLENRMQVVNGQKIVILTDEEEANIRKLFERIDTILSHYPDKDGKTFESVDFESMTESDQRQYIMQNLHLLSEADQMVVLRDLMNEQGIGKKAFDLAKAAYGEIKPGVTALYKDFVKPGIQGAGDLVKKGIEGLGGLTADALRGGGGFAKWAAKWTAIGILAPIVLAGVAGFVWKAPWDRLFKAIFPPDQEVLTTLSPEDLQEYRSIENDWNNLLVVPAKYLRDKGIWYKFSDSLNADIAEYGARWDAFGKDMRKRASAPPPAPRPPLMQRLQDLIK